MTYSKKVPFCSSKEYFIFFSTLYCKVFNKFYIFVVPKLKNRQTNTIEYEKDNQRSYRRMQLHY